MLTVASDSGKMGGCSGEGEANTLTCCLSRRHGMIVFFPLWFVNTSTRARAHSHNTHIRFSLGWHTAMTCMNHCRIPHGFTGGLAAHQILCFSSLTHFCSTPKTLVSPVFWKESCVVWMTFRWWWRQSNVYHSLCSSRRGRRGEMWGGTVADLTPRGHIFFFYYLLHTSLDWVTFVLNCVYFWAEATTQWCMDLCDTTSLHTT